MTAQPRKAFPSPVTHTSDAPSTNRSSPSLKLFARFEKLLQQPERPFPMLSPRIRHHTDHVRPRPIGTIETRRPKHQRIADSNSSGVPSALTTARSRSRKHIGHRPNNSRSDTRYPHTELPEELESNNPNAHEPARQRKHHHQSDKEQRSTATPSY